MRFVGIGKGLLAAWRRLSRRRVRALTPPLDGPTLDLAERWDVGVAMPGKPWYSDGLCFECAQCGLCCTGQGYVWVTPEEIRRIARFLGRGDGWLDKQHLRRVGLRYCLGERANQDCIFLARQSDKAVCSIYPVRPKQCRTWPFWPINLKSPQNWQAAAQECRGLNRDRRYSFDQIEQIRKTQQGW
ncbi:MAG: YkgJ family cysteine cluster protein [Phycisphaerae bacterium]